MDQTYLETRIAKTKALIESYEDMLLLLADSNGVQSFTFDTGQTREVVTKADYSRLNNMLDGLYNRLCTLEARLNGGCVIGVPAW